MYQENVSKFRFNGYVASDIKFELNPMYDGEKDIRLDLNFDYDLNLAYEEKKAIVQLACVVFEDSEENNYPFTLEVELLGFFEFDSDLEEATVRRMMELNGVTILFPYLRSTISNITSSAGVQNVVLPTMNIVNMLKKNKK